MVISLSSIKNTSLVLGVKFTCFFILTVIAFVLGYPESGSLPVAGLMIFSQLPHQSPGPFEIVPKL